MADKAQARRTLSKYMTPGLCASIFERAEEGMLVLDPQQRIVETNEAALALLGYPRKNLLGRCLAELYPADAKGPELAKLTIRKPVVGVYQWRSQQGGSKAFFTEIRKFVDGGHLVILCDPVRPIAAGQEMTQTIFENSTAGVALVDLDGRYRMVNPAFSQLFGYSPDELLTVDFFKITHPEDIELSRRIMQQVLDSRGKGIRYTKRYIHKDGHTIWTEVTSTLVVDADGKPSYFVTHINDITERKLAEDNLRESEEKYRCLVEVSPLAMWINKNGVINYMNPAALRVLGATDLAQVVGKPVFNFIHPDYHAMVRERITRMVDKGEVVPLLEEKYIRLDGSVVDVEVTATPFEAVDGRAMQVFFQDITERKRADQAIRASERRLSEALRVAKMGSWEYDIQTGLFTFNDQYYALHKTTAEAAGGYQMTAENFARHYVFPEDAYTVQEVIDEAIASEDANFQKQLEGRIICADGEVRWIVIWFRGEKDAQGQTVKLHGVNQDIHDRKLAEERVYQSAHRSEALARIASLINKQQDLNSLLNSVCLETARAMKAQAAGILLADPGSQVAALAAEDGLPPDLKKEFPSLPLAEFNERMKKYSEPLIRIADLREVPVNPASEIMARFGVRSLVIVKIMWKLQTIGALIVLSIGQTHQFEADDAAWLQTLANEAAQAIANARLLEDAKRRLERLEALRTIDNVITASLDLHHTLSVFLEQLRNQLHVDAADVLLFNSHNLTLEYASGIGLQTEALKSSRLAPNGDPAGSIVLERRSIQIPDLQSGPDFYRLQGFKSEGFVSYYGVPLISKGQVRGVLEIFHRSPKKHDNEWIDFLEALAGQAAISIDNASLFDELQRSNLELTLAYEATIDGWSLAMDMRDKETEGHTQRVTQLTVRLAEEMGLKDDELVHIRRGAMLHDIGKMGVPDDILLKPAQLDEREEALMKKHPQYAYEMLSSIKYLKTSLDIPYCHHERWDGSGYPRGLAGEQIPLPARLFAIIDVWDALTTDRPYRAAWDKDKAIAYIREQSGRYFDPDIVALFLKTIEREKTD